MTETHTPTVHNVLAVFGAATADQIREGLAWYLDAHNFATILDPSNVSRAAGIIAALSPMMGWEANKVQAGRVFERNGDASGLGLSRNCAKAAAIYNGAEPLSVLGGDKVRAFYSTILDPHGYSIPVIDRHAFDIAVGRVTDEKARGTLSRKGEYDRFGEVYIDAAKVAGVSSSQMQAITWVAWRAMKKA